LDWRFVLPDGDIRRVGFLGPAPTEERKVLEELGIDVVSDPEDSLADLDVLIVPPDGGERLSRSVPGSALRPGARVLLRVSGGGLTSSSRGPAGSAGRARRRLHELGLEVERTYWHAPDRTRCSYLVATDDSLAVDEMLKRYQGVPLGLLKSLVARAVNRTGMVELIARDLTVVARSRADTGSTAEPEDLVAPLPSASEHEPLGSSSPASRLLVTPWFEASRHVICLYFDQATRRMRGVAKLPRRPGDTSGIVHEGTALRELAGRTDRLVGQAPRALALSTGRRPFLLETAVLGDAAGPEAVRADPDALLEAALDFVTALPRTGSTDQDPSWFSRLLERPLRDVAALVGLDCGPDLVARTLTLLEPLGSCTMPLVFEHGDLGHPNLVITGDGRLGAVDWERSQVHGLPGHDLVFLLQYVAESLRATFERPGQCRAFDDAFTGSSGWAKPWLRRYADFLGLDEALFAPLILATFARSSASLLPRLRPAGAPQDADALAMTRQYLANAFEPDRDFALWRHALRRFDQLLP
jgi:aminoglycoside phosphotransferase (APT) family kinase protein